MELLRDSPILKTMTNLDLSENKIGPQAIESLGELISMPKYGSILTRLDLSNNNMGDESVANLSNILVIGTCLVELIYSKNRITEKSSESLENFLRDNTSVTSLDLSYNMLRKKAAVAIMSALEENRTLLTLDVSWNSFGLAEQGGRLKMDRKGIPVEDLNEEMDGIATLAQALESNNALTKVNLTHNGVEESGALALATVLGHNTTLTTLILDQNPLGFTGGRAILEQVMDPNTPKREISLLNCTYCDFGCSCGALSNPDPLERKKCCCGFAKPLKFNPDQPSGPYKLHLDKPSERSVAKTMKNLARSMEGTNLVNVRLDGQPWSDFDEDDQSQAIPVKGILEMEFIETKRVPMEKQIIATESLTELANTLKALGAGAKLQVLRALASTYTVETTMLPQILSVFEYGENTIEAMAILFGRVADHVNLPKAIEENLGPNGTKKLIQSVGPLYTFNMDNPCGHYRLDLANPHAKTVLRNLSTISFHHIQHRSSNKMFDLSQHGNYECFRNETMDGIPISFKSESNTAKFLLLGPAGEKTLEILTKKKGILEFDFVPSTRPPKDSVLVEGKEEERLLRKTRRVRKESMQLLRWLRWEAAQTYFSVEQAANFLELATDESMKIDMIMIFWNRIVDEENFLEGIFKHLTGQSQKILRKNIGPLKLFNPLAPNMFYTLNFWMRDEKLLARFLLELAAKEYPPVEVGVALQPAGFFDEQKGDDKGPIELKKVPEIWMELPPEGGLPGHGIWEVTYDPPLLEIPPKEPNVEQEYVDSEQPPFEFKIEEAEEVEDEELDPNSPRYIAERRQFTSDTHAGFRMMLATSLLGWAFPDASTTATVESPVANAS